MNYLIRGFLGQLLTAGHLWSVHLVDVRDIADEDIDEGAADVVVDHHGGGDDDVQEL